MPEEEATVMELIFGRWRSQTLYTGVKLGIFDAVGRLPKRAGAVAQELGLDATLCYRLLRALGCLELLIESCFLPLFSRSASKKRSSANFAGCNPVGRGA